MISFPTILLRLVVAVLLGALVGFERERNEHTAGMRTNALVALGSALFTIISAYGFTELLSIPHVQLDPTRIASYVIAGIGFLGGGAIFFVQDKERVKGLTTAAAIWIVAAIGMACGAGLLGEAVVATVLALLILVVLQLVERLLLPHHPSILHIRIETTSVAGQFVGSVYDACTRNDVTVERVEVHSGQDSEIVNVACRVRDASGLVHAIGELRSLSGVRVVDAGLHGVDRKNAISKGTSS